jgi:hypothetical protein
MPSDPTFRLTPEHRPVKRVPHLTRHCPAWAFRPARVSGPLAAALRAIRARPSERADDAEAATARIMRAVLAAGTPAAARGGSPGG